LAKIRKQKNSGNRKNSCPLIDYWKSKQIKSGKIKNNFTFFSLPLIFSWETKRYRIETLALSIPVRIVRLDLSPQPHHPQPGNAGPHQTPSLQNDGESTNGYKKKTQN
jgi:hypothetical protein